MILPISFLIFVILSSFLLASPTRSLLILLIFQKPILCFLDALYCFPVFNFIAFLLYFSLCFLFTVLLSYTLHFMYLLSYTSIFIYLYFHFIFLNIYIFLNLFGLFLF